MDGSSLGSAQDNMVAGQKSRRRPRASAPPAMDLPADNSFSYRPTQELQFGGARCYGGMAALSSYKRVYRHLEERRKWLQAFCVQCATHLTRVEGSPRKKCTWHLRVLSYKLARLNSLNGELLMGHGMRDTSAAAAFRNRNGSILEAASGAFCGEEKERKSTN